MKTALFLLILALPGCAFMDQCVTMNQHCHSLTGMQDPQCTNFLLAMGHGDCTDLLLGNRR